MSTQKIWDLDDYKQLSPKSTFDSYNYPYQGRFRDEITQKEEVLYLRREIKRMSNILEGITFNTPMWAPTGRQLAEFESLKNAYNELLVIKNLVGIE